VATRVTGRSPSRSEQRPNIYICKDTAGSSQTRAQIGIGCSAHGSVRGLRPELLLVPGPEYNSNLPDCSLLEEIWSCHGYAPQNRP
jgi:hypothetical protein